METALYFVFHKIFIVVFWGTILAPYLARASIFPIHFFVVKEQSTPTFSLTVNMQDGINSASNVLQIINGNYKYIIHSYTVKIFSTIIIVLLSDHSNEMICHFQSCFSMHTLCLKGETSLISSSSLWNGCCFLFKTSKPTTPLHLWLARGAIIRQVSSGFD